MDAGEWWLVLVGFLTAGVTLFLRFSRVPASAYSAGRYRLAYKIAPNLRESQRGASHKTESFATITSGVDPKDERSAHVRCPHAFSGMRPSVTVDAIAPASAIRGFLHWA